MEFQKIRAGAGRKKGRIRNLFRSLALACTLGISAIFPLKAEARLPNLDSLKYSENSSGVDTRRSDPFPELGDKGESGFMSLERSMLSLDFRLGKRLGNEIILRPYGYSWRLQGIRFGGGLMIRRGNLLAGGEWNSLYHTTMIVGYSKRLFKKIDVLPEMFVVNGFGGIGGQLELSLKITDKARAYFKGYLMSRQLDRIDSHNFMVGLSYRF